MMADGRPHLPPHHRPHLLLRRRRASTTVNGSGGERPDPTGARRPTPNASSTDPSVGGVVSRNPAPAAMVDAQRMWLRRPRASHGCRSPRVVACRGCSPARRRCRHCRSVSAEPSHVRHGSRKPVMMMCSGGAADEALMVGYLQRELGFAASSPCCRSTPKSQLVSAIFSSSLCQPMPPMFLSVMSDSNQSVPSLVFK